MGRLNKKLTIKRKKLNKISNNTNSEETPAEFVKKNSNTLGLLKNENKIKKNNKHEQGNSKILFEKTKRTKILKNKKEKIKLKHSTLIKKMDLIKEQELENAKKKKREQTKIVGDLKPLKDALPSLDELFKLKPSEIKTGIKEYDENVQKVPATKKEKFKKRKQEFMDRYKCFNSILKDKKFKENPRATIAEHIKFMAENPL